MKRISLVMLLCIVLVSCKKNGTGGNAFVLAKSTHHDKLIPYATIYIKYGAKDFPGTSTSNYSNSITTGADGIVRFSDLRYGDYYFYSVGFDSSIMQSVTGGDHLQIKWSDRKKTISFIVPVTE